MKLTSKRRAGLISLALVAMLTACCNRTGSSVSTTPSNNSQASPTQPSDQTSTTTTTGSTTPSNSSPGSSTAPDDPKCIDPHIFKEHLCFRFAHMMFFLN